MQVDLLQSSLLGIAQEKSLSSLLRIIVDGFNEASKTALVRVWLKGAADLCDQCHFRNDCPDQSSCLHLSASAGRGHFSGQVHININGKFRRIPLGVRKIGVVGASGDPFLIAHVTSSQSWADNPAWIAEEKIQSFAAQPLIFRGEILGVLGIFSRVAYSNDDFCWVRVFADHAAAAIANARAFEAILADKKRLEHENNYLQKALKSAMESAGRGARAKSTREPQPEIPGLGGDLLTEKKSGIPPRRARPTVLTRNELKEYERESIRAALVRTNGKVFGPNGAAALLNMKGTTLASRIKALGLKKN